MAKGKENYNDLNDSDLDLFGGDVYEKLIGNKRVILPESALSNLNAAVIDFRAKLYASSNGGKVETTEKNNARKVLLKALTVAAKFVNIEADGDESKIESTGFILVDGKTPAKLEKPEWTQLNVTKKPRQLKVKVPKPGYYTTGIRVAYTLATNESNDPNTWTIIVTTKHSYVLDDLESRILYKVCVSYMGTGNEKPDWGDIITGAPL